MINIWYIECGDKEAFPIDVKAGREGSTRVDRVIHSCIYPSVSCRLALQNRKRGAGVEMNPRIMLCSTQTINLTPPLHPLTRNRSDAQSINAEISFIVIDGGKCASTLWGIRNWSYRGDAQNCHKSSISNSLLYFNLE